MECGSFSIHYLLSSAVVEIYIETGDNLNTNNYYPPVLEEVTDAMFS